MQQTTRRELFEAYKQAIIDYNNSLEDIIVSTDKETYEMVYSKANASEDEKQS